MGKEKDESFGPLFEGLPVQTQLAPEQEGAPAMDDTLADAQTFVLSGMWSGGVHCPCCGQYARVYRRKLTSDMARFLIEVVLRTGPGQWLDVTTVRLRGGDYAKLAYWGLIAHRAESPEGQKYSGQWMATHQGRLFALDRMRVPSHVLVFDARTFGYDGSRLVSVREALGERFNYDELMAELPRSAAL